MVSKNDDPTVLLEVIVHLFQSPPGRLWVEEEEYEGVGKAAHGENEVIFPPCNDEQ